MRKFWILFFLATIFCLVKRPPLPPPQMWLPSPTPTSVAETVFDMQDGLEIYITIMDKAYEGSNAAPGYEPPHCWYVLGDNSVVCWIDGKPVRFPK